MNFLAHFHLAWPDPGLLAGGLEGDYYKGPLRGELPDPVERGVRLHRAVDAYTDSHPLVAALRREFPPELRRFAGILIDLGFDHYLSLQWHRYGKLPLRDFNSAVYSALGQWQEAYSPRARSMLQRLLQHDILNCYHDWDAVPASAARIGQRFRRGNPLQGIERELAGMREPMGRTFEAFYPELLQHVAGLRQQLNYPGPGVSNIAPGWEKP